VRALRETVKNGQKKARIAAIQTLGDIAQSPADAYRDLAKPAVPELIEALGDKDDDVRIWAAIALGQIGPDAVNAVQPLLSLLRTEENPQAICGAIQALGEIGPGAESALPVLAAIAQDPKHTAQVFAAQALWRIGSR
jgi:HEAT repeat protein